MSRPAPAGQAQPAGRLRVQDHGVADGDVGDALADLVDPAGVLVADDVGQLGVHGLGPVAVDDVQVGAADAGAADLDDHVERALERGLRYVVDLGIFVVRVHPDGLHRHTSGGEFSTGLDSSARCTTRQPDPFHLSRKQTKRLSCYSVSRMPLMSDDTSWVGPAMHQSVPWVKAVGITFGETTGAARRRPPSRPPRAAQPRRRPARRDDLRARRDRVRRRRAGGVRRDDGTGDSARRLLRDPLPAAREGSAHGGRRADPPGRGGARRARRRQPPRVRRRGRPSPTPRTARPPG